jgi:tRNA-Thr(GGU) m(6)t(6)A37 methyltransferase TsaA
VKKSLNSLKLISNWCDVDMTYGDKVVLEPLGFVKTSAVGDEVKDRSRTSEIIFRSELVSALDGISDYSHIWVLFYLDQITTEQRTTFKVHPRGRLDLPLLGVFATRTNLRPNPVGLTLVELLKVEGNVLTVKGLDAFEGTPVLDIKPYDLWDKVENPKLPDWWEKLESEKLQKLQ